MSWSNVQDEFTIDYIGARLLANLARGIYNHEAVLREYVQNARDSYCLLPNIPEHATINIRTTGDSGISIQDNGVGMDEGDIKASKKIAVSPKSNQEGLVGFRGIGIWAGFQACEQLEIDTTKLGDSNRYRLQIDFGDILQHVDEDINIKELLDNRFRIDRMEADQDEHFTIVKLVGLRDDYKRLANQEETSANSKSKRYHVKSIHNLAMESPVTEFIQSLGDDLELCISVDGEEVFKKFPAALQAPQFVNLEHDGEVYARAWFCSHNRSISHRGYEYRNFRLRIQNFAVGRFGIFDDEDGSGFGIYSTRTLNSAAHLNWHVGEIHILHPDIKPDTPRSSLELDTLSRRAIEAVRVFYEDRIADSRALADLNSYNRLIEDIEKNLQQEEPLSDTQVQSFLSKLQKYESGTRGRQPSDKRKRRLREFLSKLSIKRKRRQLLQKLNGIANATQPNEHSQRTDPPPSPPSSQQSPSPQSPSEPSQSEGGATATITDYERLLSEIFTVIQSKIVDDFDLSTELCEGIKNVFETNGLIDA